jgi:hypothetical protein
MQRIFIKKCFPFTVESVCRVKQFTTGWKTFRWWRRGWNAIAEVADTTAKRLQYCGFRCTGKAMGRMCQCWWRICQETIFFPQVRIWHVVRFISICDLFTGSPSCIRMQDYIYLNESWGVWGFGESWHGEVMSESGCHCCKQCERNTITGIIIWPVEKNPVVTYPK